MCHVEAIVTLSWQQSAVIELLLVLLEILAGAHPAILELLRLSCAVVCKVCVLCVGVRVDLHVVEAGTRAVGRRLRAGQRSTMTWLSTCSSATRATLRG